MKLRTGLWVRHSADIFLSRASRNLVDYNATRGGMPPPRVVGFSRAMNAPGSRLVTGNSIEVRRAPPMISSEHVAES
jgi:hypothetical protein